MKESKLSLIAQGVLFIFIGIISLVYPVESISILSLFFQLLLLTLGIIKLIKTFINKNNFEKNYLLYLSIFEGVIFIIVAAVFYFNKNLSLLSFGLILGLWCTYNSLIALFYSFKERNAKYWYAAPVLCLLALASALMIVFKPYKEFLSLTSLMGIYFLCSGIELLFYSLYIKKYVDKAIIIDAKDVEIIENDKSLENKED
ncbi:DUF308 domain-containing protein [Desnuesiella massiliensis]|uniref:DUF308 domain-containing protein n=1 Tax=Desnuesiella massiliensis TaxID=1650662 RepID=UPI0006E15F75|nr:DUF308 domain-containing protein [Desnuesiella massiliensis]